MCVAYGVERIATEPAHLPPTRLPEDAAVETDVHRLRLLCRGTFEGKVKDLCCLLFSYATLFFFFVHGTDVSFVVLDVFYRVLLLQTCLCLLILLSLPKRGASIIPHSVVAHCR